MKKFLLCLLVILLGDHALSVPQSDAGASSNDYEMDYSEPGVSTEDCICVPFYQCVDGEIVSDGTNLIGPRKRPQEVKLDEKYVPPECGPYHVCCRDPEASTVTPYIHRCGTRNPGGINGRILTAQADGEAEFGEWPWQAAILTKDGEELTFKCGGTLIDKLHVLTVAHCVDTILDDNVIVRLGEWDTQNEDEFYAHEDYEVEDIITHPQYRPNNLFNDIAILKLDREVSYKPHIDTACLPTDDDNFTGQNCVVTGWGTDAYKSSSFSMIMKEVSLPVVGNAECQNMLRKTRLGRFFKLHESFLCAGGKEGEDSCKGDGGGPLVCYKSDTKSYTVVGLVSWGIDCGKPNHPGVYTNVQKYIDWIASKTGKPIQEYWSTQ